ncbi:hypothetical protein CAL19_02005 [Bordetella genomosp. 7]|uniref:Bacteriophage tail tape measure C-terminal domain-containing protein n=2 Tax=Bordetella genomosp. 7 TaxID=1416805 RepID=A0A261RTC4_9BORD|nr:hypothetical protein CAL19_02005 [Bordetella genomosp. 7]
MAAVGAAVAGAAAALVTFTSSAAKNARELANLSRLANTGMEEFQGLAYAARNFGVEQGKLSDILKDVNERVGEFNSTGGGPMKDFFEQIAPRVNLTANAFRNLSGPQALQLYYDSLVKAGASQQELTFYMEAMASDATALIPLLRDNGQAIKDMSAEAQQLGIVLSEIEVGQLVAADAAFAKMNKTMEAIKNQIAVQVAPLILELSHRFTQSGVNAKKFGEAVVSGMELAAKAVAALMDGYHALKIALAGVEIVGRTVALGIAKAMEAATAAIAALGDFAVDALNKAISAANNIPGIDIPALPRAADSDFLKGMSESIKMAEAMLLDSKLNLQDLVDAPSALSQVDEFFAGVRQRAEDTGKVMADLLSGYGQGGEGAGAPLEKGKDKGKGKGDNNDGLQNRLDALRDLFKSETELELEAFYERQELLAEAREKKLISDQEYQQMEADLAQMAQDNLTAIDEKASKERQKLAEQERSKRVAVMDGMLGNLASLMDSGNKKMFQIGKVAAIAQALLSARAAITHSYEAGAEIGGPVLGAAFAATAAAATAAQIASIKNTQFGGGGGVAGGAYSKPSDAIASGPSKSGGSGSKAESPVVNISLQGDRYDQKSVRGLIEAINEAVGDGARLRVT